MQCAAQCRRQTRRRGFLHQLLIAPLSRAVALAQVDDPPVAVAQNLHLHMPAAGDVALQIHARIAECGAGLGRGQFQSGRQDPPAVHALHAASAAAADRLDQQRHADGARRSHGLIDRRSPRRPARPALRPLRASARARNLSPTASIWAAVGPMKTTPCGLAQAAPAPRAPTESRSPDEWHPTVVARAACTMVSTFR